jgi:fibronectin-binding autotransporter adhesin
MAVPKFGGMLEFSVRVTLCSSEAPKDKDRWTRALDVKARNRALTRYLLRSAAMLVLGFLAFTQITFAQADNWNQGSGTWSKSSAWSNGVPTPTSDVHIGSLAQPAPPVTLDISSQVNSLALSNQASLTLQGDSAVGPTAAVNLTVAGTAVFGVSTNVEIGAGSSLTLNGASTNAGTIQLDTTTIIAGEAPARGTLNGSGTLTNSGIIQGTGVIGINVTNTGAGALTGSLTLSGNTVTGGSYNQGTLTSSNATVNNVQFGGALGTLPDPSNLFNKVVIADGSTLTVQGAITNIGTLQLGNGGSGTTTISGVGATINNEGVLRGVGTISTGIDNTFGTIEATASANPLVLQGKVTGDVSSTLNSSISIVSNSTLDLDGSQVSGNTIRGNGTGGLLVANNGATLANSVIDGTSGPVILAGGSILGLSGVSVIGQLTLGSGGQSATLNGSGTLTNVGTIGGLGQINLDIANTGGAITGALTLNRVTVTGGSYNQGTLTSTNATFTNVQFGGPVGSPVTSLNRVTIADGSTLSIQGGMTNIGTLQLGSGGAGATINGAGVGIFNEGFISGTGTIAADINNSVGTIQTVSSATPLVLQGNISGLATKTGSQIILAANSTLVLDGATVNENTLVGFGGTVIAKNGATFDGSIDGTNAQVVLAGGSVLGIELGTALAGQLQLGTGTQGATLNGFPGSQLQLSESSIIHGGGTINVAVLGTGTTLNGGGSIIADNASAPLVLAQNVTGSVNIAATNGGTLTLANVQVTAASATVAAGSTLNGSGTIDLPDALSSLKNAGTIAPGVGGAGLLVVNGIYAQSAGGVLDFALGGTGDFSQMFVENPESFSQTIASFDRGSIIDASFFGGFDPSSGCATTFGVCESFNIFETTNGTISGFNNIAFDLPTLPANLQWLALESPNDQNIVLEVEGAAASGGIGAGGSGSGGTSPVPEPSTWALLAVGLFALLAGENWKSKLRRARAESA